MLKRTSASSVLVIVAAGAFGLITVRCKDSNAITNPGAATPGPTATPVPTPAPVDISGTWTGTFDPTPTGCSNVSVTAVFEQQGPAVQGTFHPHPVSGGTIGCGGGGLFTGTLTGNRLVGTLMGGTVTGGLSGTTLGLVLNGQGNTVSGSFQLHR